MVHHLVEQEITIKMAQGRKLASHGAAVNRIAEQLLDEFAHVVALGIEQRALALFQKTGELPDVGGVGRDGKRRQSLFDFQIVEEPLDHASIS